MQKILPWIATVLVLLVGFGTIYATVQQSQRNEANWPQIQIAQDTASSSSQGAFEQAYSGPRVDMSQSLAVFTNVYKKDGTPISGTGYLDGKLPKVDPGVLENAKDQDYNAVTWEPKEDVRIAAVAVAAKDYYVVSGRNLKEVEKNEKTTLVLSALGFLGTLIVLGLIAGVNNLNRLRQTPTVA